MHVLCACGVLWRQEARREGSRYYTYFITSDVDRWAHGIGPRCFGRAEKSRVWTGGMSVAVLTLCAVISSVEGSVRGKRACDT